MPFYLVNRIGDGTINNKFRPDVDDANCSCGWYEGINGQGIAHSEMELGLKIGRVYVPLDQLEAVAVSIGINYAALISRWGGE